MGMGGDQRTREREESGERGTERERERGRKRVHVRVCLSVCLPASLSCVSHSFASLYLRRDFIFKTECNTSVRYLVLRGNFQPSRVVVGFAHAPPLSLSLPYPCHWDRNL